MRTILSRSINIAMILVILTVLGRLYFPPFALSAGPTIIFSDNFEGGNLSKWSNCPAGSPVINLVQSTTVHAGSNALRITLKHSADNYSPCIHAPSPAPTSTRHYVSFWVNWGSTYACRNHWWRMRFGDGTYFDYNHDFAPCRFGGQTYSDGPHFSTSGGIDLVTWVLKDPFVILGTSVINPYTPVMLTGWHHVEMLIYLNTPGVSDGTVKVWFNGVYAVNSDSSELQPYSIQSSPGVPYITGNPKRPRGGSSANIVDLEIMTNADIINYHDCATKGSQPCHDGTLDYFLYVDDVEWWTGCPPTGASCSSGDTTPPSPPVLKLN